MLSRAGLLLDALLVLQGDLRAGRASGLKFLGCFLGFRAYRIKALPRVPGILGLADREFQENREQRLGFLAFDKVQNLERGAEQWKGIATLRKSFISVQRLAPVCQNVSLVPFDWFSVSTTPL